MNDQEKGVDEEKKEWFHIVEDEREVEAQSVHHALERVAGIAQPKWHREPLQQVKEGDEGCLVNVPLCHGDLIIPLGLELTAIQPVVEAVDVGNQVTYCHGCVL